jgi:hypothetical protein
MFKQFEDIENLHAKLYKPSLETSHKSFANDANKENVQTTKCKPLLKCTKHAPADSAGKENSQGKKHKPSLMAGQVGISNTSQPLVRVQRPVPYQHTHRRVRKTLKQPRPKICVTSFRHSFRCIDEIYSGANNAATCQKLRNFSLQIRGVVKAWVRFKKTTACSKQQVSVNKPHNVSSIHKPSNPSTVVFPAVTSQQPRNFSTQIRGVVKAWVKFKRRSGASQTARATIVILEAVQRSENGKLVVRRALVPQW